MKLLLLFVITLATASALGWRNTETKKRNTIVEPAVGDGRSIANFSAVNYANYNLSSTTVTESRITNDQFAEEGQFPYQAYLDIKFPTSTSFCGGSLIGRNWVLTAAQCTLGAQTITVYLGSIRRNSGEVKYTVNSTNIIIHFRYSSSDSKNDISLIKIPSVAFSSSIQPIRLPSCSPNYDSYAGYNAIASGFGQTLRSSNHLKWARMEVINNRQCSQDMGMSIPSTNMCASTYYGVSACFADSGGPLVLASPKILIGVTSFCGSRDCAAEYPVAFTRVTRYLAWIKYYTGIYYALNEL